MAFRQVVAASLATLLAVGAFPLRAQQQGSIAGRATEEAETPYNEFTVRVVRPDTGEIITTQVLDAQGLFSISGLPLNQDFILELVDTAEDNEIVCTEGPFNITPDALNLVDLNIDCGSPPAALWIIAGAAGLVTAIGLATASNSTGDTQ